MSKWFQLIAVALLLAGCTTTRRNNETLPENWQSETITNELLPVIPSIVVQKPQPHISAPPVVAIPNTNKISESWISLDRWTKFHSLPPFKQISPSAYALTIPSGVLLIHINERSAQWNGVLLQLGYAPQLIDGQPSANSIDAQKNFLPLLFPAPHETRTGRIIVLDPGHGGADIGARNIYNNRPEKDFTLDCARRLQFLLSTNGWKVFLTRSNDVDVPLTERVAFADRMQADLFISLHFNSGGALHYSGLETYCLTPQGLPSTLTRGYNDETAASFPNNSFDAQNLQLAERLHRALLHLDGKVDRGIRHARFMTVLRGQHRPAVLVEGGYLSSRDEAQLIGSPEYREKYCEALAAALAIKSEPAPTIQDNDR